MSQTTVDTSYRAMSVETLTALRLSALTQLKAIEGTGQSHSANGRQTNLADFDKLTQKLASVEAALDWKRTAANEGNKGFASRYACFNHCGNC